MSNNTEKFFKEFEQQIFPIIKGEDGQGIARFKAIVDKKRMDVQKRKHLRRS